MNFFLYNFFKKEYLTKFQINLHKYKYSIEKLTKKLFLYIYFNISC